ncbi:PPOX class F420-dependent oxidoreductase [Cryptosporangium sp. NPDC051539]|uniref:PPOX class F420-dependent oxidoreductase n=1 Tax=Cryptosporangium sp. NPDC051539 TaxID=3363962 RepID=UPI00379FF745
MPNSNVFTEAERTYLTSQRLGRLATVDAHGVPQNNPVGFAIDPDTGAIDIGGFNMGASRKFRNVRHTNTAAFVVDDIASVNPWKVRGIEVRGDAEAIDGLPPRGHMSGEIIRIHPRWILSWGVDPDLPGGSRRV